MSTSSRRALSPNAAPSNERWLELVREARELLTEDAVGAPAGVNRVHIERALIREGMARTVAPKRLNAAAQDPASPIALILSDGTRVVGVLDRDGSLTPLEAELFISQGGRWYVPTQDRATTLLESNWFVVLRSDLEAAVTEYWTNRRAERS